MPVVIEALRFTGHNDSECLDFCPGSRDPMDDRPNLIIPTSEGDVLVNLGDWILKDQDRFFRCPDNIFSRAYHLLFPPNV